MDNDCEAVWWSGYSGETKVYMPTHFYFIFLFCFKNSNPNDKNVHWKRVSNIHGNYTQWWHLLRCHLLWDGSNHGSNYWQFLLACPRHWVAKDCHAKGLRPPPLSCLQRLCLWAKDKAHLGKWPATEMLQKTAIQGGDTPLAHVFLRLCLWTKGKPLLCNEAAYLQLGGCFQLLWVRIQPRLGGLPTAAQVRIGLPVTEQTFCMKKVPGSAPRVAEGKKIWHCGKPLFIWQEKSDRSR